jgi:hypothetical protein
MWREKRRLVSLYGESALSKGLPKGALYAYAFPIGVNIRSERADAN